MSLPAIRLEPRVKLRELSPDVVEIVCHDRLEKEDTAYLTELGAMLEKAGGPMSLLFQTLAMTGYSFDFPLGHVEFFRQHASRIFKIAVVHKIPTVSFAIATVSLASRTTIKGFSTRTDALNWISNRG